MEIARVLVMVLSGLLITISLIPLIRKDNWFFRVFEYPRAQKLIINASLIISMIVFCDLNRDVDVGFLSALVVNLTYLTYQVWPYTIFCKHQLHTVTTVADQRKLSLLIFNVFQDNQQVDECIRAVQRVNPDLVLLVEINNWWKKHLDQGLLKVYKYQLGKPLENTYGIMLYSKLELVESEIRFLVDDEIPSIKTLVKLPSGDHITLYGLHPQPPVPQENPRSTERDAEILLVGKEAKQSKLPVVVAGDLNDVAWSYTTELFMKVSGLLDPRRGRGFYNTFHAKHWFLRWPLDHIFCSVHFQLISMKRLPALGSDHFPIFVSLALKQEEKRKNEQEKLTPDARELETAQQKMQPAGKSSRKRYKQAN